MARKSGQPVCRKDCVTQASRPRMPRGYRPCPRARACPAPCPTDGTIPPMSSSSAMATPVRSLRSKRTMPAPSVLILEKMPDPGGISITSGGNVRIVDDAEQGFRISRRRTTARRRTACCARWRPACSRCPPISTRSAKASGAIVDRRQADGNYPFPGHQDVRLRQHQANPRVRRRRGPTRSSRAMCRSTARPVCGCSG